MKKKYSEDELMAKAPVSTAVANMAIPSVISSLVTVLYNMADTFFVGQTKDALQVAAVSLTNPCFILMMAVANVLGMGGSTLISNAMGAHDSKKVKQTVSFVFWASMGIGILMMALMIIFMKGMLTVFGADTSTYAYAQGYAFYVALGAPFIIWSAAASFIVRAAGASSEAMIGSMIGTIANIILDPIFISVLGHGAAGAAIATTISNLMASIYFIWYILKKNKALSISIHDFTIKKEISAKVFSIGMPTGILSALMSVSTIILNQILVVYGNEAVAAIGIVFKANMFITFFQMGLANGVQPILGYCYGAHNMERFQQVERYTRTLCLITGCACTALYFIFRRPLIALFINDEAVIEYGVQMLLGYMISGPFIGILFMNMNCMQSVGRPAPSTLLSILRQGVLLIPLLYLLRATVGYAGVICGQSITDIITVLLSIYFWDQVKKNLSEENNVSMNQ